MAQMATRLRLLDLADMKVFVLDEADNMIEQGAMSDQSVQIKKCVWAAVVAT